MHGRYYHIKIVDHVVVNICIVSDGGRAIQERLKVLCIFATFFVANSVDIIAVRFDATIYLKVTRWFGKFVGSDQIFRQNFLSLILSCQLGCLFKLLD